MKKLLSLALLLLAITACGTKDNVEKAAASPTPTESSDELVFVKKLDGVQSSVKSSISRSTTGITGSAIDFADEINSIKNKYNTLVTEIDTATGRTNIPNDTYFIFDKKGNILEIGLKMKDETGYEADKLTFNVPTKNFPVLMGDTNYMFKHVKSYIYAGAFLDGNNDYDYSSDKYSVRFENGSYKFVPSSENPNDSDDIVTRDSQGKLISIETLVPLRIGDAQLPLSFKDNIGNPLGAISGKRKYVFNYDEDTIELYVDGTQKGTFECTSLSYENNELKIDYLNVFLNTPMKVYVTYNSDGKVTAINDTSSFSVYTYKYDNDLGLLTDYTKTVNNEIIESMKLTYTKTDSGLFEHVSREVKRRSSMYNPETETVTFSDWDTTLYKIDYTRDSSDNILEVAVELNLGGNINMSGTFIPKQ